MDGGAAPAELAPQRADARAASEASPASDVSFSAETNSVYDTAEFHIYVRKIISCSKRFSHEWTTCPFAHPGEKARRRDPRTHQYDCEMCPAVVKGEVCELGAACPHSHHVFESWLHPQKFRTMLCKGGGACHREVCFFAHGAEQLRVPGRDLPHMPSAGPSRLLRQSASRQEQDELARRASAGAAAAARGMFHSPESAALPAAMAAVQLNAGNGCSSSSSGRHVWFAQLPQPRIVPMAQQAVTCNMILGSNPSNMPGMQGGTAEGLPYSDGFAGFSGASAESSRLPASGSLVSTGNNSSGGWPMSLLPGQLEDDSRRSSLCESCTSSMMRVPVMTPNLPFNSPEQLAGGAMQLAAAQQRGAAASANGLMDTGNIRTLLSSLVHEIKTTRQEAVDSCNASVQAQNQPRAITGVLASNQGTATLDTTVPTAALAAAMPPGFAGNIHMAAAAAGARGNPNMASPGQLQPRADSLCAGMGNTVMLSSMVAGPGCFPDQLALFQQPQSAGLVMVSDPATPELSHIALNSVVGMRTGLQHTVSDGSSMSMSSSWLSGPGSVFGRAASAGPLAPTADARQSFETARAMSTEQPGLLSGASLDRAAVAAAAMAATAMTGSGSSYSNMMSHRASGMETGTDVLPRSYVIANGNAALGSVINWPQLLPAASGIDAANATRLLPPLPNWHSTLDSTSRANDGSASTAGVSTNDMQQLLQQQQSQSDYLLQLLNLHGMLSAPELPLLASTGPASHAELHQAQSGAAVPQGWARSDAHDFFNSGDTMEGVLTPNDVAASFNDTCGSRSLGWL